MGRKKLSPGQETDHLGMKMPTTLIEELIAIGDETGQAKSTVGRNLLLLGKAVYDACLKMGIKITFTEVGSAEARLPIAKQGGSETQMVLVPELDLDLSQYEANIEKLNKTKKAKQ